MSGAVLKVTNSPSKKRLPLSCSIYVNKVMKLLAFIFEQPSYMKFERNLVINEGPRQAVSIVMAILVRVIDESNIYINLKAIR